jgi:hypothetical protein
MENGTISCPTCAIKEPLRLIDPWQIDSALGDVEPLSIRAEQAAPVPLGQEHPVAGAALSFVIIAAFLFLVFVWRHNGAR